LFCFDLPMEPLRIDEKTLQALDFAPVAEFVAKYAVCSLGRERVLSRIPQAGAPWDFDAEQALVREVWSLYAEQNDPPLAGLFDAGPLIEILGTPGGSLDPHECVKLARFASIARPAHQFGLACAATRPLLSRLLSGLEPMPDLVKAIDRVISEDGLVRDSASPELARVRIELRRQDGRLQSEIVRLAKHYGAAGALQDNFHTLRGGRYCLPVMASRRSSVPGIVHGRSKTGETVFVEPMEVVEASNDLAELLSREADEVQRVLVALAQEMRPKAPGLAKNLEIFAVLDDLSARARCGWENGWRLPRLVGAEESLRLDKAHHPLLWIQRREQSVPIDAILRRKDRLILLSGPNAGGKTTALKLVGLMTVLAQAGFPLPCGEETILPVSPGVALSIGDDQSVAQGESTFSAHIHRLERILAGARQDSLVLLDEIASGTDPTEGGALAIATLEELVRRGARVFCSSHLRQLMDWAETFEGARNASFRLDPDSGRPTFNLTLDVPGHSNALRAAERFGFPQSVVERARELIPRARLEAAELLETLHAKNKEADDRLTALQVEVRDFERKRIDLEHRASELREEKRAYRERLSAEKSRDIRRLRAEIEKRIAELPAREGLILARRDADEAARQVVREAREQAADVPAPEKLEVGAEIYVTPLRSRAKINRLDRDRGVVVVSVGGIDFEMRVDQLSTILATPRFDSDESDADDFDLGPLLASQEPEPPAPEKKPASPIAKKPAAPAPMSAPTQPPAARIPAVAPVPAVASTTSAQAIAPAASAPAAPAASGAPLVKMLVQPGKGLFRRRREEQEAEAKKAAEEAQKTAEAEAKKAAEALKASKKNRGGKKREFSEEEFFASSGPKSYKREATKIVKAEEATVAADPGGYHLKRANPNASAVSLTLELHGQRVDEALKMVDDYLDHAIISDWPYVRLMHGVGTGTLQRAIRAHLKDHPSIRKAYPADPDDGGSGVTIVEFKE
jgi:DNA mismatch repair protein MutS2